MGNTYFKYVSTPSLIDAEVILKHGIENRNFIIIVGSCIVDYHGRASSTLSHGERVVIVKADGSIQIHRPKDVEPVNWQPPRCIFHVNLIGNELRLRAIRSKPREIIDISFDKILFIACFNLVDEGEFSLHASEIDMQKAIIMSPNLIEEGFKIISFEKHVEPGFIDLYGLDSIGRLVVLEIKRRTADKSAVLQLAKYVSEIKSRNPYREVRGILVAPSLSKSAQSLLHSLGLEFKRLNPKVCAKILNRISESVDLKKFIK
ncbi:MAG: endonuclease NucS [Candidatus Methanomethylicia archaeon]|nr:endonuclease NucS [Candidatus Methanomethylicia archaeon]